MTSIKNTKVVIEKIDRIEVEELRDHDGVEILERSIVVWDKMGNRHFQYLLMSIVPRSVQ
jgi:hypothetical protein